MLENPTRGERYGFGTLAEFYEFLATETSWRVWQGRPDHQPESAQDSIYTEGKKGRGDDEHAEGKKGNEDGCEDAR